MIERALHLDHLQDLLRQSLAPPAAGRSYSAL
jgi:hypothetical protein